MPAPRFRSRAGRRRHLLVAALLVPGASGAVAAQDARPPSSQNPSPMVEHTRAHGRLPAVAREGRRSTVDAGLPRPIHIFVPARRPHGERCRLLLHFHGAPFVAEHAASRAETTCAVAVVNLGAGSGAYERAFTDPAAFDRLLGVVRAELEIEPDGLVLSAFSAGHGAVRAILRESRHLDRVDGALLLDGIHTSYEPAGRVLAEGGSLDTVLLAPVLDLARRAGRGEAAVLATHSAIFPGTFASTTETTDYIIDAIGARRTAVLEWGPMGMQQLSEVRIGGLLILGFAGNSAPDHIDHLHGMPEFLRRLERLMQDVPASRTPVP